MVTSRFCFTAAAGSGEGVGLVPGGTSGGGAWPNADATNRTLVKRAGIFMAMGITAELLNKFQFNWSRNETHRRGSAKKFADGPPAEVAVVTRVIVHVHTDK